DIHKEAEKYINEEVELSTIEDVLAGVNDIIAEWISDDPTFREYIRKETFNHGLIRTEVKNDTNDEKNVYQMYYDFQEAVRSVASHRVLAINRGEKEDVLRVSIDPPVDTIIQYLEKHVIKENSISSRTELLEEAIED